MGAISSGLKGPECEAPYFASVRVHRAALVIPLIPLDFLNTRINLLAFFTRSNETGSVYTYANTSFREAIAAS
jgi:hypothetical protein